MDKNSRGLWLLPSHGRVNTRLQEFLNAARKTNISTPGAIIISESDYCENVDAYDALELPEGWSVHVVNVTTLGEKMNQAYHDLCEGLDWIGALEDDLVPETDGWDVKLLGSVEPWNFVSTAHGTHQANRLNGARAFGGDLVRAIGYIYLPGIKHFFQDDIFEDIGRQMNIWHVRKDIMVRHDHVSWTPHISDSTHEIKNQWWVNDEKLYSAWVREERLKSLNRIGDVLVSYGVSKPFPDLSHINLVIACPSGDGKYDREFQSSLFNTITLLRQCKANVSFSEVPFCADLALARCKLFGQFLRSGASHCLMVDSDMGWRPDDVVKLLEHKRDFVAAAGIRKVDEPSFAVKNVSEMNTPMPITIDGTGLMEVSDVGAAFVLISRQCAERMRDAYEHELAFETDEGRLEYMVFCPMVIRRRYRSEDFAFCYRWRKLGGKVYVDPMISLRHVGTKVWSGAWADAIAAEMAAEIKANAA